MNAAPNLSPTTFAGFYALGFTRLAPIVPHDATISEKSSLALRVGTDQDSRGKAVGVRGADGKWRGFDWVPYESDERDCERWEKMCAGIGIKTGQGIVAIDADTTNQELAGLIMITVVKHCGMTPVRIGNFPKALYLVGISAPMKYARVEFGELDAKGRLKDRVEILSDGRQFVAHGTHPKTLKPYVWTRPIIARDQLPVFTPAQILAFLEELRTLLPAAKPLITEGATTTVSQAALKGDIAAVRKAVAATPNTSALFGTREAYRDYGYAIRASLPDDEPAAFEIFSEWCSRWMDGVNAPKIVESDWSRMKPPFRRGASWIFELAEKYAPEQFKKVDAFFDVIPEPEASLFGAVPVPPLAPKTDTYPFLRIGDIVNRPPPVYLVRRHIPEISVGFLYSVPGAGKTFLALDAALHIAYGRPSWHGDDIRAPADTVVVYIAAEGSFGFAIASWHGSESGAFPNIASAS
jgi:AAA domain